MENVSTIVFHRFFMMTWLIALLFYADPEHDNNEDRDYEEDITMTQEELADDIRWEESPGVEVRAQESSKPVVPIRGWDIPYR